MVNYNRTLILHGHEDIKPFGVTISTFWGHVTSSVTWPLDSQHMVSY